MLFRYKIDKSGEYYGSMRLIHYNVTIQRYNPNNMIFKWETCKGTSLKCITETLSKSYLFSAFENALPEIAESISKYGGVDNMVIAYIRKVIMRDMKTKNEMTDAENLVDNLVLTNGWKAVEIKENE